MGLSTFLRVRAPTKMDLKMLVRIERNSWWILASGDPNAIAAVGLDVAGLGPAQAGIVATAQHTGAIIDMPLAHAIRALHAANRPVAIVLTEPVVTWTDDEMPDVNRELASLWAAGSIPGEVSVAFRDVRARAIPTTLIGTLAPRKPH